jgi:hypothetical protein
MLSKKGSVLLKLSAVKAPERPRKNRLTLAGSGGFKKAAGAAVFTSCR